jgi:hypothetical protein
VAARIFESTALEASRSK